MPVHRTGTIERLRRSESTPPPVFVGRGTSGHNAPSRDLADLSDGWPRHLRHAGESLAEEALRVYGDMDRMDRPRAGTDVWRGRRTHCDRRHSPGMRLARALLLTVMRDIPVHAPAGRGRSLSDMDVPDRLRDRCRRPGPVEWRLPKGLDAEGILDHPVHRGTLHITEDGDVHSPVPSFRPHLIRRSSEPDITSSTGGPDRDSRPTP